MARSQLLLYVGMFGLVTASIYHDVVLAITAATAIIWNELRSVGGRDE